MCVCFFTFMYYKVRLFIECNCCKMNLKVTCKGSQAPLELLVDCFANGFLVVVVESNFHVAVEALLFAVLHRLGSMLLNPICDIKLNRDRRFCSYNRFSLAFLCMSLVTILSTTPLVKLLQFLMSLTHARLFFNSKVKIFGVSLYILHDSTPTCDENFEFPALGVGIDSLIAYASSMVFLTLMMPVIYTISKVLVPFG